MSPPTLSYKKSTKKLREIESLKKKQNLTPEESAKIQKESYYKNTVHELTKKQFHDLPDDVLYIIMSFLPYNTRLSILKQKYPIKNIISKLEKIPHDNTSLMKKLHKCATMAFDLNLHYYHDNTIMLFMYMHKSPYPNYDSHNKCNFIRMIFACCKNYTQIYKPNYHGANTKYGILFHESSVFKLYSHVLKLC